MASCDKTKDAYPSSTGPTIGREPLGGVTKGFSTGIGSSALHLACASLGLIKDRVAPAATFVLMLRLHMPPARFGRANEGKFGVILIVQLYYLKHVPEGLDAKPPTAKAAHV